MSTHTCKVAVVGGGPAGLAAAAALALSGLKTICVSAPHSHDGRTVAIMMPGIRLLSSIGAWDQDLKNVSCALQHLHIKDDTGNLVSAPDLLFAASELKEEAFGWNIPLDQLTNKLHQIAEKAGVSFIEEKATSARHDHDHISITTASGAIIEARLAVAADGIKSTLRKAAGIDTQAWSFDQDALITRFSHSAPHNNTSTEWHRRGGLFTTVPMPDNRSSLVWMDRPQKIKELAALDPENLAIEIQLASHGTLGRVFDVEVTQSFPMRGQIATRFAANRTMLIGEAAHVFPPVGAQGLNMSFRDAGHVADTASANDDPGCGEAMLEYDRRRQADIQTRTMAISLVNHTLLAEASASHLLRATGFAAIAKIPPLRNLVMRQGLSPEDQLPYMMRAS